VGYPGIQLDWGFDPSDTQRMPSDDFSSDYSQPPRSPHSRRESDAADQLFHVEQLGVVEQLDRIGSMAASLSADLDEMCLEDLDRATRARMFAHEVNNLVVGISGRAERAMGSGDPAMTRQALEMAVDLGARVRGLCGVFMEGEAGDEFENLGKSQILDTQEFASISACEYLGIDWVDWVVELDEGLDVDGGVPMGAGVFGQVLLNLYRNALAGIARGVVGEGGAVGGTIRLRVMRLDGEGGVVVRVEDSGVGFGDDGFVGGGYGLGLRVCRALCAGCGGRVEVGESAMLGGGRVDVVFD
jgi:signal transduction histidine kinase